MGTWGPGVFENDKAADHIYAFTERMIHDIEMAVSHPSQLSPGERWGEVMPCHIEMLLLLHREFHGLLPDRDRAESWRETYMKTWESDIDALQPKPAYRKKRREVLNDLFGRLIACTKEHK